MTAPVDQSVDCAPLTAPPAPPSNPTSTPSSNEKVVAAGAEVPCAVQTAQDFDTYIKIVNGVSIISYVADVPLTYQRSADKGSFKGATNGKTATWIAPDDITGATSVTIKCTIDDLDGPRADAPDTGSRDDTATVRSATVTVKTPTVEFTGEQLVNQKLRACAGGVDDHAATDPNPQTHNDAQYRAHTRKIDLAITLDGNPMGNAKFTLRFEGNKGHDYGDGRTRKMARLHKTNEGFDAAHPWKETLEMTTNSGGKVSVWVLSSDVINQPKLQAILKPVAAPKEPVKLGEIECDFAAPITFRHAPNPKDPDEEEDRGWIFDFPKLVDPDNKEKLTPAKLYLKFKKFPDQGDDYTYFDTTGTKQGNWQFVNGHNMKMFVAGVKLYGNEEDETFGDGPEIFDTPQKLSRYAFITSNRAVVKLTPNTTPNVVTTDRKTALKGETAPQVYVRAGIDINDVNTIWVDAQDLNIWKD